MITRMTTIRTMVIYMTNLMKVIKSTLFISALERTKVKLLGSGSFPHIIIGRDQPEDDEDIEEDNQQWFPEHSGTENTSEGQNYVVHKISSEDVDDEEEQPER